MNNNRQQQAVILKGIAHQILNMNVPSIKELNKLLSEFNLIQNVVVLTTSPQSESIYTELPFVDKLNLNYFIKRFSNLEEADEFAENEADLFNSKVNFCINKIVDNKYISNLMSMYGGNIFCIYECNGREWIIWDSPNWINF